MRTKGKRSNETFRGVSCVKGYNHATVPRVSPRTTDEMEVALGAGGRRYLWMRAESKGEDGLDYLPMNSQGDVGAKVDQHTLGWKSC